MEKFSSEFSFGAYFGKYPDENELELLIRSDIKLIVDLTNPRDDVPDYSGKLPSYVRYIKYPIHDTKTPAPNEDVAFNNLIQQITAAIHYGDRIYIHCRGGHGRAGMVAAVVLSRLEPDLSSDEVLKRIHDAHQRRTDMKPQWRKMGSPQTRAQKSFVRRYVNQRREKIGHMVSEQSEHGHEETIVIDLNKKKRQWGLEEQEMVRQQDSILQEQDEQLTYIADTVKRVKDVAINIGKEVDTQNHLLDELNTRADETSPLVVNATKKVEVLKKKSSNKWLWICIAMLVIVVVAVLVAAFYRK